MNGENIPEITCRWSEESSREIIRDPAKGCCASAEQVLTSVLNGYFR
jgi:hypothetical protein